jgi:hypothetical protein
MFAGQIGDWRYGGEPVRFAWQKSGYSADVLSDLVYNILVSYSPQKIILSKENIPRGLDIDTERINRGIRERLLQFQVTGIPGCRVETGSFDEKDRARAAAALVFDHFFHGNHNGKG